MLERLRRKIALRRLKTAYTPSRSEKVGSSSPSPLKGILSGLWRSVRGYWRLFWVWWVRPAVVGIRNALRPLDRVPLSVLFVIGLFCLFLFIGFYGKVSYERYTQDILIAMPQETTSASAGEPSPFERTFVDIISRQQAIFFLISMYIIRLFLKWVWRHMIPPKPQVFRFRE